MGYVKIILLTTLCTDIGKYSNVLRECILVNFSVFQLLWIILVASCAALIIQSLAANLGVVTGMSTDFSQISTGTAPSCSSISVTYPQVFLLCRKTFSRTL